MSESHHRYPLLACPSNSARKPVHDFEADGMSAITLTRRDATRNLYRFYRLDVQPDLFGDWRLVKGWGRIGCPGKARFTPFPTAHEAQAALERQRRAKERRGYG